VHHTHKDDELAGALLDLVGFLNSPQRDDFILREAGVSLDRALFPLLVRLGVLGELGVVELADQVGRDHSTVSRLVAKLESQGLVVRQARDGDQRVRAARITPAGEAVVAAIAQARQTQFDRLFRSWSDKDREALGRLNRRFADALLRAAAEQDGKPERKRAAEATLSRTSRRRVRQL
jgi:DNA-binding MarR family transcriptional regulator